MSGLATVLITVVEKGGAGVMLIADCTTLQYLQHASKIFLNPATSSDTSQREVSEDCLLSLLWCHTEVFKV